jgi:hypothetical protein
LISPEKNNVFDSLKIPCPFVARFIGYYLGQEYYKRYNVTFIGYKNEMLDMDIKYDLMRLICFCFTYDRTILSNTVQDNNDLRKELIPQIHYFTMNLLKTFSSYRDQQNDLIDLEEYVTINMPVKFYTSYKKKILMKEYVKQNFIN